MFYLRLVNLPSRMMQTTMERFLDRNATRPDIQIGLTVSFKNYGHTRQDRLQQQLAINAVVRDLHGLIDVGQLAVLIAEYSVERPRRWTLPQMVKLRFLRGVAMSHTDKTFRYITRSCKDPLYAIRCQHPLEIAQVLEAIVDFGSTETVEVFKECVEIMWTKMPTKLCSEVAQIITFNRAGVQCPIAAPERDGVVDALQLAIHSCTRKRLLEGTFIGMQIADPESFCNPLNLDEPFFKSPFKDPRWPHIRSAHGDTIEFENRVPRMQPRIRSSQEDLGRPWDLGDFLANVAARVSAEIDAQEVEDAQRIAEDAPTPRRSKRFHTSSSSVDSKRKR